MTIPEILDLIDRETELMTARDAVYFLNDLASEIRARVIELEDRAQNDEGEEET